eukprot:TRINITY_DN84034_c0_g1_i1.p1 TRINITY_DN84034_c0_g1~~TRINITY_DN84034_c0_g1_i1.p1  ORF type:complete len:263 (-),score=80.56 TRINITY_DN84034_c0_g1_i1:124-912(-)
MAASSGEPDNTERIMEYQRREYAMLSKIAQRKREMAKMCQESSEVFHAFEDNQKDSLRNAYVDPAVNIEIGILRQRLREKDAEIAKLKDELGNAEFQPNSIQGKKLLDKCSHLLEENAEIARQLGEERMQVLRIQLVAERQKKIQLRQRLAEFDRHGEQVDAENERMQVKIADLGKTLKETRAEIDKHKKDVEEWRAKSSKRGAPDQALAVEIPAPVTAEVEVAVEPQVAGVDIAAGPPPEKRQKKEKKRDKEGKRDKKEKP